MTDLLAFCAFFIVGLMIGMITFQFSNFSFGIGNAAGLLFAGIMLASCERTIHLRHIPRER
ncbi:MAG: hypothetical protein ACLTXH_06445 [Enterobacter hormaechei]